MRRVLPIPFRGLGKDHLEGFDASLQVEQMPDKKIGAQQEEDQHALGKRHVGKRAPVADMSSAIS